MNEQFTTMLFDNKFLIIKTPADGKPAFVFATAYTEAQAATLVKALELLEQQKAGANE